jgi:glutathione S-transferase
MRLYHHPQSLNARRALLTLAHLGLDAERVVVDLGKGDQRRDAFLKLNPNGKVPVLEDDGFVLWESHAIQQYLADKAPKQTVYPTDARARADVNRWLFWSAHHFTPAASILNWERRVKGFLGLGGPDPAMVKRGEEQVLALARVLDAHLDGRSWIAQDAVTLADLAIAPALAIKDDAQLPVGDLPRLLRWLDRVQALDAWRATEPR